MPSQPESPHPAREKVGVHPSPLSPERVAKVDAARQEWIRKLVDLSRRNNLLYFRDLKVGTLDLTAAPVGVLQRLFQSGRAPDDGVSLAQLCGDADLFSPIDATRAAASLKDIAKRAASNFEEKGLDTLFLAVGVAAWTAGDEGRDTAAPVLLVPIQAVAGGGHSRAWMLRRSGDIQVNSVLSHALQDRCGLIGERKRDQDDVAEAIAGRIRHRRSCPKRLGMLPRIDA